MDKEDPLQTKSEPNSGFHIHMRSWSMFAQVTDSSSTDSGVRSPEMACLALRHTRLVLVEGWHRKRQWASKSKKTKRWHTLYAQSSMCQEKKGITGPSWTSDLQAALEKNFPNIGVKELWRKIWLLKNWTTDFVSLPVIFQSSSYRAGSALIFRLTIARYVRVYMFVYL